VRGTDGGLARFDKEFDCAAHYTAREIGLPKPECGNQRNRPPLEPSRPALAAPRDLMRILPPPQA